MLLLALKKLLLRFPPPDKKILPTGGGIFSHPLMLFAEPWCWYVNTSWYRLLIHWLLVAPHLLHQDQVLPSMGKGGAVLPLPLRCLWETLNCLYNSIMRTCTQSSWSSRSNKLVKSCNQKFDLRVLFITLLHAFGHVQGTYACHSTPLLKGPAKCSILGPMVFFFNWDSLHASLNSHTRHGVTRKRKTKRLSHTGNLFRKNLQLKDVC